ncbi:hypothetical protein KKG41_04025 [Patescibacteria group bacterium]|nr:hypothetical protein [Patescibacteria group bacterium]MBU1891044.1 hypothetical protein [Patescibacteria group bacterium]
MANEKVEVIDDDLNVLEVVERREIIKRNLKHKSFLIIVKNSQGQYYVDQRKKTKKHIL